VLADLWIHELAGKGDLEPLAKVCHRYCSGLDDGALGYAADSLRRLRGELDRRSAALRKIPKEQRPEGKVTRELAALRRLGLRPLVAFFDEVQNLFMHPAWGKDAQDDAGYVVRLGRAYGVILVLATQRPDKDSVPTAVTGTITCRFCLQVPGQVENDLVLGTSSYKNGYNATAFRPKTDAGLGWLKADGPPQIVRTYKVDLPEAEKVAARARDMRDRAGVLTGYALGVEDQAETRDVLADVLAVFGADAGLQWDELADRLAARFADRWADATGEAVSAQCRAHGVPSVNVNAGGSIRKGCRRVAVERESAR
jgi:S-DNA-T family DNA segregation ATPase FtsK/SpoIIIE